VHPNPFPSNSRTSPPGAYWEAGFAEGLGKPVIYTCSHEAFADPHRRPHFDTNYHLTVIWSIAELPKAAGQLKPPSA
jgi:hypothetical protein